MLLKIKALNMNKIKHFYYILIFILLANCGYKINDQSKLNLFSIADFKITGDNKINFFVKNKINSKFSKSVSNKPIKILLATTKDKKIKEKNIKNQITKYEVDIISEVEIIFLNENLIKKFTFKINDDYDVATSHITTIDNKNNSEKRLADKLSDEIIKKITRIINDL